MTFIDLHCDTLMLAHYKEQEDLYDLPGMLDIRRMKDAGQMAQFFAMFMPPLPELEADGLDIETEDNSYINSCLAIYDRTMARYPDMIAPAYNLSDLKTNWEEGRMSGFLTIEDGRPINGRLDRIKEYYDRGVRLVTLTWNHENSIGYPNSTDAEAMALGLKPFGREAVELMNDLGIIVDVSHLSDGGFWDVAEISKQPFVASHSNARSLSPHPRNLTDDMIKALADAGGIAGINFCPAFLTEDLKSEESRLADLVRHIEYLVDRGGIDLVALGSDLDGVSGNLEIGQPTDMPRILEALDRAGYSTGDIEKIAYGNAMRLIGDVMK